MLKSMTKMKRLFAAFALIAGLFTATLAQAGEYTQFSAALRGYDAVAYQTMGKAVEGNTNYSVQYNGQTYLFASQENASTFSSNPAKYEPAYNGYCAMGVALGKKLPIDPQAFAVVDGKLYMNLNKDVQAKWRSDIAGHIKTADMNWNDIKDVHPEKL